MPTHKSRQMTALMSAPLIALMLQGAPVNAQGTPAFNPNADDARNNTGDSNSTTGGSATGGATAPTGPLGDINSAANDINSIVNNTSSDIDAAVQQQLQNLTETISNSTDNLLGNNSLGQIDNTIGTIGNTIDTVTGAIDNITSTFNSLFDLNRLFDLFSLDLPDIFSGALGGLSGSGSSGGSTVQIQTGALGLPDPKIIEQQIQNAAPSAFEEATGSKTGGSGSPVIKDDLVTLFETDMTDEIAAQTALTEDGQQKLRENAEAANSALETSTELASDSEGQDVSQNILRNISAQLAAQQQTGTLDTIDAQLRARDDALRNKMLVDAVRELQGDRLQDRRQDASAYSDAITQGGQLILPGTGINPAGGTP